MTKPLIVFIVTMAFSLQTHAQKISEGVSDNGIAFSLVEMPGNSRVTVQIAWPSEWAFNSDNNQAVPHVASQLLLAGGAKDYAPAQIIELFQDMGSEGYLAPQVEYVIGTLHYSPEHQEDTLTIVNAHLKNPSMDQRWLERVRDQFAQQMNEQGPGADSFDALRWSVFGDQPARAALSPGSADIINSVSQEDTRTWARTVLTKSNPVVVIAGDLDTKAASKITDTIFQGVPDANDEGKPGNATSVEADFSPKRLLVHNPASDVSTLSFVGPLPAIKKGAEFADLLLLTELGQGAESILFNAVRTKMRAAHGYGAGISAFTTDTRFLVMSGQVETSRIEEAETVVREAYARFLNDGPFSDLAELKEPIMNNLREAEKDTGASSYSVLQAIVSKQPWTLESSAIEQLEATTEELLKERLSSAFPAPDELFVLVSSPDASALPDACVISQPSEAVDC